jgi:hypothetical protein
MIERTKRKTAPFWIPSLDILKLALLIPACLGLFWLGRSYINVAAPTIAAAAPQFAASTRGEVTGTAPAGSTVRVYNGNTELGSVTADAEGKWRMPLPPLAVGSYVLTARAEQNGAEWASQSTTVEVIAPTAVPAEVVPTAVALGRALPASAPVILSPAGGTILAEGAGSEVNGSGNSGNKIVVYADDKAVGETVVGPNGRWSVPLPPLAVGAHQVAAKAIGGDGIEVASAVVNVIVQAAPPTASATATAIATAVPAAATATEAPVQPTAAATAAAVATATREVAVAAAEPPAILSPLNAGGTLPVSGTQATVVITGVAASNSAVQVVVDGVPAVTVTADANGAWQAEVPVPANDKFVISAQDANGTSEEVPAEVSARAPAAPAVEVRVPVIVAPVNNSVLKLDRVTRAVITGTAAANSAVAVSVNGRAAGTAVADVNGVWRAELPALAEGAHVIVAEDANGKSAEAKVLVYAPPVITAPSGSKVQPGATVLKGKAPANSRVIVILDGDQEIGRVQANAAGNWAFQIPPEFAVGAHTVKVRAEDANGVTLGESTIKELDVVLILPETGGAHD